MFLVFGLSINASTILTSIHTHTLTSTVFMKFCCPNNWILSFSCAFSPFLHLIIHNCDIVYEIRNKCIDIGVLWLVGGFILLHVPLPIVIHNESASFNENRHRIYYTVLVLLFSSFVSRSLVSELFSIKLERKIHSKGQCKSFTKRHWSDLFRCFYSFFFCFCKYAICIFCFFGQWLNWDVSMYDLFLRFCTWCVLSPFFSIAHDPIFNGHK